MTSYIRTYTGVRFVPTEPEKEKIEIKDIAHALPMLCRGNGHVKTFWSVGEHCICCAKEALARGLGDRLALACLYMMPASVTFPTSRVHSKNLCRPTGNSRIICWTLCMKGFWAAN